MQLLSLPTVYTNMTVNIKFTYSNGPVSKLINNGRGDQIFFSATCPGQVASKNPLVLRNFLLVPKYFSHCISFGQVVNTTISYSKCNSNQTVVDEGSSDL